MRTICQELIELYKRAIRDGREADEKALFTCVLMAKRMHRRLWHYRYGVKQPNEVVSKWKRELIEVKRGL